MAKFDLYSLPGFPKVEIEQDGNLDGPIVEYYWPDSDDEYESLWSIILQDDGSQLDKKKIIQTLNKFQVDWKKINVDLNVLVDEIIKHAKQSFEAEYNS